MAVQGNKEMSECQILRSMIMVELMNTVNNL